MTTFSSQMIVAGSLITHSVLSEDAGALLFSQIDAQNFLLALGDQEGTVKEDETLSAAASGTPDVPCPADWRHRDGHTVWIDDCTRKAKSSSGKEACIATVLPKTLKWREHLPVTASVIYALRRGVAGTATSTVPAGAPVDDSQKAATEIFHQMLNWLSSYRLKKGAEDIMLPPVSPFGIANLVHLLISEYGAQSDAIFGNESDKKAIIHHIGENWAKLEAKDELKSDEAVKRHMKHHTSMINATRVILTYKPRAGDAGWVQPKSTTAEIQTMDLTSALVHISFLRDKEENISMHSASKGGHALLITLLANMAMEDDLVKRGIPKPPLRELPPPREPKKPPVKLAAKPAA